MKELYVGKLYKWVVYSLNGKVLDAVGETENRYIGSSIREMLAEKNNVNVEQITYRVELRLDNPHLY